jgi:pectate lyase
MKNKITELLGQKIMLFLIALCIFQASNLLAQDQCQAIGWATYDGQKFVGAPTGGGSATIIQVTTFAQLKSAVESSSAAVIHVMNSVGNGYLGTTGDVLIFKSNKTIIGVKPGIVVKCSWQIKNCSNIVIRNLQIQGPGNTNSNQNWDAVNIENSQRVWVDHCIVIDGEDGNFDVVKGSDNVSATWCIFTYTKDGVHNLSNLIGSSDTETQSHGKLNVTYANCWWKNCSDRLPRTRYGKVHVVNCNYTLASGFNSANGSGAGFMANTRIENCSFEKINNPCKLMSGTSEGGSFAIGCKFTSCTGSTTGGAAGGYTAFTPPYEYKTWMVTADKVKAQVESMSGNTMTYPFNCGSTPTVKDCNGDANGTAVLDNCGVCTGGKTGKTACVKDCNGDFGGTAVLDNCAICVGGKTGKTACIKDCNGDLNGTAKLDVCGVCTGGKSIYKTCIGSLEAETACTLDGTIDNNNAGFSGTGFANTSNILGASATWYLNSSSNQTATITFRYANGGTSSRDGSIKLNGVSAGNLALASTGAWTTWLTSSVNLNLKSGSNEILVTSTTVDGLANIDLISFSAGVSDGKCVITGLESNESSTLILYPNPTESKVSWDKERNYMLRNIQGIELVNGYGKGIDLINYPKGIYFIQIEEQIYKVVKE